jgi:hypothetical protein
VQSRTRDPRPGAPTRRRPTRLAAATLLLSFAAVLASCKLDEVQVPAAATPGIVVHAVLDPFTDDEVVLVEQLLIGEVEVDDRVRRDTLDPIVTGGGIPIRDALVILRDLDTGDEATGVESATVRADGKGQGVYRVANSPNGVRVRRGGRYELEVRWRGLTARAQTTVPDPSEFMPQVLGTHEFNVDHDSLVLDWNDAQARRFVLLAETPYAPFRLFSARDRLVVRGTMRNLFAENLPPVFVPGFIQTVSTAAVDTNYFDYYRSFNNPFTGSGIINHIDGGVGVFGSIVPLDTRRLDVTADFDEPPIEGHFLGGPTGFDSLELYLGETLGGGARRVSGTLWRQAPTLVERYSLIGVTTGANELSLSVRAGVDGSVRYGSAAGVAAGDSVVLMVIGLGSAVFRRIATAPSADAVAAASARHIRFPVLSTYAHESPTATPSPVTR